MSLYFILHDKMRNGLFGNRSWLLYVLGGWSLNLIDFGCVEPGTWLKKINFSVVLFILIMGVLVCHIHVCSDRRWFQWKEVNSFNITFSLCCPIYFTINLLIPLPMRFKICHNGRDFLKDHLAHRSLVCL